MEKADLEAELQKLSRELEEAKAGWQTALDRIEVVEGELRQHRANAEIAGAALMTGAAPT